jgi:hypothetical protein
LLLVLLPKPVKNEKIKFYRKKKDSLSVRETLCSSEKTSSIRPSKSGDSIASSLNSIKHSILPFNPHLIKSRKPTAFMKALFHSFMPIKNLQPFLKIKTVSFWHLSFFLKIFFTRRKSYNF